MAFERPRWMLEYAAVRTLAVLLACLPLRTRIGLGRALGRTVHALDGRHRGVALANLEAAYPEADSRWRAGVAKGAFEHLGRLLVEILGQGPDVSKTLSLCTIEGWDWLKKIESQGRGYFLLSGHFGNWERIAHLQGALSSPLWMVARPLDNPYLEDFFARRRGSTGNRVVHKRNAIREVAKGLKAGKGIAFVIDQNFGEAGRVFVPFFGRPAATTPALGRLAVRFKAPVLPVFSFPEPGGRYRIVYGPPLEVPDTGDAEADALDVTARATIRIEEAIRACPAAWFWMHRRWRTRPDGERDGGVE